MANALVLDDVSALAQDVTVELDRVRRTIGHRDSLDLAGQLLAAALAFVTNEDSASRAMLVLTSQLAFLQKVDALQRAEAAGRVVH